MAADLNPEAFVGAEPWHGLGAVPVPDGYRVIQNIEMLALAEQVVPFRPKRTSPHRVPNKRRRMTHIRPY